VDAPLVIKKLVQAEAFGLNDKSIAMMNRKIKNVFRIGCILGWKRKGKRIPVILQGATGMFMKSAIAILIALSVPGVVIGQHDQASPGTLKNKNVLLDAHTGYSLPFGKFSQVDSTDDLSGYARDGLYVEFSGTWLGKRGIGLSAAYTYQRQWLSPQAANITPDGHNYTLGKNPWNNHYLLVGPAYTHNFGKLFFLVKAQIGLVLAFTSNFYMTMPISTTDSMVPPQTMLSQGNGFGIAFQGSASIGYRLSDYLSLTLSCSYLGANPSRKKDYYWYKSYVDGYGQVHYIYEGGEFLIKKKISTLIFGAGIAYRL